MMKKTIIEDQGSQDHDTLIRVETKVDALVEIVNDLKSGILSRIVRAETRLDAIDVYHATIPLKDYDANSKWVTNFRSNLKFITVMITILATLFSGLFVTILQHLFHF